MSQSARTPPSRALSLQSKMPIGPISPIGPIKKEECTIDIAGLNLYKKIQLVKEELAKRQLPKTGKNTYSNYNYYQLEDIMPSIIELCNKYNLFTKPLHKKT